MDAIDRKILDFVQLHGRSGYAEIGVAAGLSVSSVAERLRKLEAAGIIRGWSALVSPEAVDRAVLAFMFVAVGGAENERRFLDTVRSRPEVLECHHVTGDWSYILKLRVGSITDLEQLLGEAFKVLPGIGRTHTMIALSSPKETGVIGLGSAERG
jgi:Lrp/AsnC family transcriptional regulator, leucine-responsive regulatory protein